MKFFERHPFAKFLVQLSASIIVAWNTIALCILVPFVGFMAFLIALTATLPEEQLLNLEHVYGDSTSQNKLLSIKINGIIDGEPSPEDDALGFIAGGMTYGYEVKEQLYAAATDPTVKGVVLEVNSPGGTIYGSQAISDGVEYYRSETGNPVITYVGGLAASGAYWAAVTSDEIIADHGSIIGSIGVITGPFKYYNKVVSETGNLFEGGVITQNGIESVTISAGRGKDMGDPYRRLSTEEISNLQASLNNEYDVFVKHVSASRGIAATTIRNQIGALVYDNKSAIGLKLIDKTGSREDAYSALAQAAKIDGDDYQILRQPAGAPFFGPFSQVVNRFIARPAATQASRACPFFGVTLAYHGNVNNICPTQ